jgi:multidrug resistance efflux pump
MALVLGLLTLPVVADESPRPQVVATATGYVVSARMASVCPKVAGTLLEVKVEEGQVVKQGEVIGRLDPAEYRAGMQIAEAELKMAAARFESLARGADRAEAEIARSAVEVARSKLELARLRLDGTVLRAPITGTVIQKRLEVGAFVNPMASPSPGAVCELADLRQVEIEVWLGYRAVGFYSKGHPCLVRLDTNPRVEYRGSVTRILPAGDKAKGAIGIRVKLELPEKAEPIILDTRGVVQFLSRN